MLVVAIIGALFAAGEWPTTGCQGTLFRLVHTRLPPTLATKTAPAAHVLLDRIEADLRHRAPMDFQAAVRAVMPLDSADPE